MPHITVDFSHVVQDSQDAGSDDDHMVSRVFFSIAVDDKTHAGLYSDLKQTAGSNYATDPVEVSRPANYSGPLDWNAFRRCVERYYRMSFGPQGSGIAWEPGATNLRMRNNVSGQNWSCSFEASDSAAGW